MRCTHTLKGLADDGYTIEHSISMSFTFLKESFLTAYDQSSL